MKKIIAVLYFAFSVTLSANAQSSAKSMYFELGGPGLASVNYDMRFAKKEDGLGFRVGVGGFSLNTGDGDKASILFVPLGLNYLIGKDGKNYFEIGGGLTFVSAKSTGDDAFSTTFGHLNFGYRLQPRNGGFLFRAGIVPIFNKNGFVPYYAGISFGYKF